MKKYTIYANCQGEALAKTLSRKTHFSNEYHHVKLPPVQALSSKDTNQVYATIADADLIIAQPVGEGFRGPSLSTRSILSRAKGDCTILTLPSLYFDGYFPHIGALKCVDSPHSAPFNLIHNYYYALMWAHGFEFSNAESFFTMLEAHYANAASKFAYSSVEELRARESKNNTTIMAADFILCEFNRSRLFHTPNHPTNRLLEEVGRQVLERLFSNDVAMNTVSLGVHPELLGAVKAAIYPSIASSLNLQFYTDGDQSYQKSNKTYTQSGALRLFWDFYDSQHSSIPHFRDLLIEEICKRKSDIVDTFNNLFLANPYTAARHKKNSSQPDTGRYDQDFVCKSNTKPDHSRSISAITNLMRRKLWLHIGHPKCGSTFIQSTLASNHDELKLLDISYPVDFKKYGFYDEAWLARNSRPSMGNCNALFRALSRHDKALAQTIIDDLSHTESNLFLSCEGLFYQPEISEFICKSFAETGFDINIIAFVPNTYRACVAGYLQRVRNHRYHHTICDFIARPGQNRFLDFDGIFHSLTRLEHTASVAFIPYTKEGICSPLNQSRAPSIINDLSHAMKVDIESVINAATPDGSCSNKSFCAEVYQAIMSFNLAFSTRIPHQAYQNISRDIDMGAGLKSFDYFFTKEAKNAIEEKYSRDNDANVALIQELNPEYFPQKWASAPQISDLTRELNKTLIRRVIQILIDNAV